VRREGEDVPQVAPRSSFAESLAAQADDPHAQAGERRTPPVPRGDAVMPMGTVLGGSASYPPLPPPQIPPPPPAPPADEQADPLQDWAQERPAQERPAPPGHQLGPVVGQQGPLPDLGATPPGVPADDDWAARFGALAEQLGEPRAGTMPEEPNEPRAAAQPEEPSRPAADQPWPSRPGPDPGEPSTTDFSAGPAPRGGPEPWSGPEPHQLPGRRDEPFGRPYGQEPGPPPQYRPAGPEPARPRGQGQETPRATSRQAGTRSRRGRPEDPRQAAVYDALAINEQVLDEVWTSPSVDVLKVVSSIVVNALDAYEDDPAEYADWVAVHRTGNCDCH
jgi:hypothetical protein